MLIESEAPSEKQLLKTNSITTKLIPNSATDSSTYRHLQLYNQSLNEKKMNNLNQYQFSPVGTNLSMMNANASTLNRLNGGLNQTPNGMLNQSLNHGTIRPHNQANQLNGVLNGLTPLQNNIISNYATISRAAHNQLNGHGLNGPTLITTTQVPNSQHHLNTQAIYQQLTPLNGQINLSQFQLANGGIYSAPQFGLEVGLDLNRTNHSCCCCCFYKRCNISRVSCRARSTCCPACLWSHSLNFKV